MRSISLSVEPAFHAKDALHFHDNMGFHVLQDKGGELQRFSQGQLNASIQSDPWVLVLFYDIAWPGAATRGDRGETEETTKFTVLRGPRESHTEKNIKVIRRQKTGVRGALRLSLYWVFHVKGEAGQGEQFRTGQCE